MLTRNEVAAETATLDTVSKKLLLGAIRKSDVYRNAAWLYPDLDETVAMAASEDVQILKAGLTKLESYGDGTDEQTPTRSNNGLKSSIVRDREDLIKFLLSTLYKPGYLRNAGYQRLVRS